MKHIVVTTDFSLLADKALPAAADLAKRLGAKLTLIHSLGGEQPPKPIPNAPYYNVAQRLWEADAELQKEARLALEERAHGLAVAAEVAIVRGDPVEAVVAWAKENGVDLVVISSAGKTGVKRALLGSVAEEMARSSPIPVLIWKSPPEA